jgi:hypothetical protein
MAYLHFMEAGRQAGSESKEGKGAGRRGKKQESKGGERRGKGGERRGGVPCVTLEALCALRRALMQRLVSAPPH